MAQSIYVVDDIPDFLDLVDDVLTEAGYDVSTFSTAADAVRAIAEDPPDLIITDLRLGEESGFDLLRQVIRDPSTKHVPLLLCTAATMDVEENGNVREIRAVPVIYKPFDIRDFVTQVGRIVDGDPPT